MEHRLAGVLGRILSQGDDKLPKIQQEKSEPKVYWDMAPEVYHADKRRMSSSAIRKILRSPRHFLTSWTDLDEEEDKDHFRIGRAAHSMVLEPQRFKELYVVMPDFGPMQSSKNRAARDAWKAEQNPEAIIVTEKELDHLVGMVEAVMEHPVASGMLKNGRPECTLHWQDEETGILCKSRPDYIVNDKDDNLHLIDFKTSRDIRPGIFARDAYRMQYGVQLAFYHDGLVRALGRQPQSMTIICVEKEPPYEAAVYPLEDRWFEKGQEAYRHALRLYKKCRDTGHWPAFQINAQLLSMPREADFDQLPEFEF